MAAPEPATATFGLLTFGGILASAPLGVSVETIALGMAFAAVGVFGRLAFDIQKALEVNSKIGLIQALKWVSGGLLGAPFITIAWIVFLRTVGVQTDTATVLGLLFLGYSGPKGVTWLLGMITDFVKQRMGLPKDAPAPPNP